PSLPLVIATSLTITVGASYESISPRLAQKADLPYAYFKFYRLAGLSLISVAVASISDRRSSNRYLAKRSVVYQTAIPAKGRGAATRQTCRSDRRSVQCPAFPSTLCRLSRSDFDLHRIAGRLRG